MISPNPHDLGSIDPSDRELDEDFLATYYSANLTYLTSADTDWAKDRRAALVHRGLNPLPKDDRVRTFAWVLAVVSAARSGFDPGTFTQRELHVTATAIVIGAPHADVCTRWLQWRHPRASARLGDLSRRLHAEYNRIVHEGMATAMAISKAPDQPTPARESMELILGECARHYTARQLGLAGRAGRCLPYLIDLARQATPTPDTIFLRTLFSQALFTDEHQPTFAHWNPARNDRLHRLGHLLADHAVRVEQQSGSKTEPLLIALSSLFQLVVDRDVLRFQSFAQQADQPCESEA